ncbi:MAG TPA: hypothetical protein VFF73_36405, partial [Planctomycetota bacterium]|nr:hypothetical protein [Planctomycetota bacterium]
LKVAKTMFFDGMNDPDSREPLPVSWALTLVAGLLVLPVLGLGLAFNRILDVTLNLVLLRS